MSTESSNLWETVKDLELRLCPGVVVSEQTFRNAPWFVLNNRQSGQSVRLSARLGAIIEAARAGSSLAAWFGERDPGPEERQLLAASVLNLYREWMLDLTGDGPLPAPIAALRDPTPRQKRRFNPVAIRVPLVDPDAVVTIGVRRLRGLFHPVALIGLAVFVLLAAVNAAMHWQALTRDVVAQVLNANNLLLFAGTYAAVKLVHELAHAMAVKYFGGRVHELGVMFLVFFPVPYCDASASAAFPNKWHRIAVSLAGIAAELVIASIALFVWIYSEPGTVRAIAYNAVLIGSISTVVFNGNPLLKFDAYYALSDLIEIPNLFNRSRAYLKQLALRHLFGAGAATSPISAGGERVWLLGYGVASTVYRVVVMVGIIVFLANLFFVLGLLLAAWYLVSEVILPLARFARNFEKTTGGAGFALWPTLRTGSLAAGLVAALFFVPVPHHTVVAGAVTLKEQAVIRTGVEGFIAAPERLSGAPRRLAAGAPLLALDNATLERDLAVERARIKELSMELAEARTSDEVATQMVREELKAARENLAELNARDRARRIAMPVAGQFLPARTEFRAAEYLERGATIGIVHAPELVVVRAAIPEDVLERVTREFEGAELRFAQQPEQVVSATTDGEQPAAITRLPAKCLGSAGGGPIPVDPSDPDGLKALGSVFQIDLKPKQTPEWVRIGTRAFVRFEHRPKPLGVRLVRATRRFVRDELPG